MQKQNMEWLIEKSEKRVKQVATQFKRYLFSEIDRSERLVIITGYRGVGKTTMVLQYLQSADSKGIYLSLDDLFFESHRLIGVVHDLYKAGYRLFMLDEVHRYAWWSKDLKQLYDDYPDAQFVATGSSILELSKGNADLSRRAAVYSLQGLSFREYLSLQKKADISPVSLAEVLTKHHEITPDLLDLFSFKTDFADYLRHGYFPFFTESTSTYFQKSEETINLVIDTDIAPFKDLRHATARAMKKLLFVLSESVPFKPNIQKLSVKMEITRNTLLRLLDYLDKARIVQLLKAEAEGVSYLQKPEKIYLNNTNFIHLFANGQPNTGSVRETFFFNQLSALHSVTASKFGDFTVDDVYTFEVGGANKGPEQIKGVPNAYLAVDIEGGSNKRIPLWLFGMLY